MTDDCAALLLARRDAFADQVQNVGCCTPTFIKEEISLLDARLAALGDTARECEKIRAEAAECRVNDDFLETARAFLEKNKISCPPTTASAKDDKEARPASSQENVDAAVEDDSPGIPLLTAAELEAVPKYMKGRITLVEVNEIVRAMSDFLIYKHGLLRHPYGKLSNKDKDLVNKWKDQGSDSSTLFCLDVDIKDRLSDNRKKNIKTVLPIMRHLRRIKEERVKNVTRLIPLVYKI